MRRGVLALGAACTLACGGMGQPILWEPGPEVARLETALAGETLAAVAARVGVSPFDLGAWNGIEGEVVPRDRNLIYWPPASDGPDIDFAAADPTGEGLGAPPARGGAVAVSRPAPERAVLRRAGLLGVLDGLGLEDDPSLSAKPSLQVSSRGPRTDLSQRGSLSQVGRVEASGPIAPIGSSGSTEAGPPGLGTGPVSTRRFSPPAPKACLAGPDTDAGMGEDEVVTARGLTPSQIRQVMNGFGRNTLGCFPAGTRGRFEVLVEVVAGCDGRVQTVQVLNAGGLPGTVTTCVREVMSAAGFPAHGMPDGVTFQYPLVYTF